MDRRLAANALEAVFLVEGYRAGQRQPRIEQQLRDRSQIHFVTASFRQLQAADNAALVTSVEHP